MRPNGSAIEEEFLTPTSPAARHNSTIFSKNCSNTSSIACANFTQTTMVRHCLIQVVADVPATGEIEIRCFHELSFRTNAFKEHYELQLEEDDWVNRRTTQRRRVRIL